MRAASAILGAAGLAIALSLQGSLANFAAGLIVVAFRMVRVGDMIEMAALANGVALNGDSLYVADTALQIVWRIPLDTGLPQIWKDDPLLKKDPSSTVRPRPRRSSCEMPIASSFFL